MTKEDLVIEFHNKLDRVEKEVFDNIDSRRKAQDKLLDQFYIENHGSFRPYNSNPETISIPFNYEFYIKEYRCKIAHRFDIKVLE